MSVFPVFVFALSMDKMEHNKNITPTHTQREREGEREGGIER